MFLIYQIQPEKQISSPIYKHYLNTPSPVFYQEVVFKLFDYLIPAPPSTSYSICLHLCLKIFILPAKW